MKIRPVFRTVKGRLIFWFLLVTLTPLVIAAGVVSIQRSQVIKANVISRLTAIRDLKVDQLTQWIDEKISDVKMISQSQRLLAATGVFQKSRLSKADHQTLQGASALLDQYLEVHPEYEEAFIINPVSGDVALSTDRTQIGTNESQNPSFTEVMRTGRVFIRSIYYSPQLHQPTMAFSTPLRGRHRGGVSGVLVIRIDLLHSLYALLLDRSGMGRTGETLIVDSRGTALNELRWHPGAPLRLRISTQPAVMASQGKTGIIEADDYRGEPVMAAFTYLPRPGWGFVAKQDLREIDQPIRQMLLHISIVFLISAVGVSFLAVLVANRIARPILEMADISKKIEAGDLSHRNRNGAVDELGFLARSIDGLVDSMASRIQIQRGVADLNAVMMASATLQDLGDALLGKLMEITGSQMGAVHRLSGEGDRFELLTAVGVNPDLLSPFAATFSEGELGRAVASQDICHIRRIPGETLFTFRTFSGTLRPSEIMTIPVRMDGRVVALVSLASLHPYPEVGLEIVREAWSGMSLAVSNRIAGEKTERLATELHGKNQELESQAEELRSISEELRERSETLQKQNVELENQKVQVEEANRMKSEFLSNMSHELRTPLNSVMALSRVLISQAAGKLSDDEVNYLKVIERNGKNLLSLINDILDLAKIEAGRISLRPTRFSVAATIETILERLAPIAEEKGLTITRQIEEHLPKIESDEIRVHQILQNLIGNAVKFTLQGTVTVGARSDEEGVYISVADTGIGIPAAELPNIFKEFKQIDGTSARAFEGTGLGLAIAYKSARLIAGDLTVQSTLGSGSTFSLALPLRWQETVPSAVPETPRLPGMQPPAAGTILVVDDEPEDSSLIADVLSSEGYHAICAASGAQALRMAKDHYPNAIILDVIMPEMDGWEVLQQLKAAPATSEIPVIVISKVDGRETGLAMGAIGYMQKPLSREALMSEIRSLVPPLTVAEADEASSQAGRRILVVEDNEVAMAQVKHVLEMAGYAVDTARGGQAALDYFRHTIPDGIVLDLMMPEIDGFQVLESIRSREATSEVPVLVLTAKDLRPEELKRLRGNHIKQLVQKGDVARERLLSRIRLMLEGGDGVPPERETPERPAESVTGALPSGGSLPPSVLVVEDHADSMTSIRALLGDRYRMLEATDGEKGLEMALSGVADLILLDISLPKMDGMSVVRGIKADERGRHIPVIALTASAMKGDRERILAAGCDDYIAKPVDPQELVRRIDHWIGR